MTLTGLANLLNDQEQNYISKDDFWTLLKIYTKSQHLTLDNGNVIPWIDENLNPFTGDWISRTMLKITNLKREAETTTTPLFVI